jgi:hypothetical protein
MHKHARASVCLFAPVCFRCLIHVAPVCRDFYSSPSEQSNPQFIVLYTLYRHFYYQYTSITLTQTSGQLLRGTRVYLLVIGWCQYDFIGGHSRVSNSCKRHRPYSRPNHLAGTLEEEGRVYNHVSLGQRDLYLDIKLSLYYGTIHV